MIVLVSCWIKTHSPIRSRALVTTAVFCIDATNFNCILPLNNATGNWSTQDLQGIEDSWESPEMYISVLRQFHLADYQWSLKISQPCRLLAVACETSHNSTTRETNQNCWVKSKLTHSMVRWVDCTRVQRTIFKRL